jgi:tetratricopeptide (TPR) repeat protein
MKTKLFNICLILLFIGLMTQGFSCGSPDFEGAKVREQQKDYPEAAKLYEKDLQKNPANQEEWFLLGRLRGTQLNDFVGMDLAFKEVEKISNKYSAEINAYRNQFWVQHINAAVGYAKRAKDSVQFYDNAIEEYNNAALILPDTSLTYHYMALTYVNKGDVDNTILNQKKAWDLGKDKEQYKQIGAMILQRALEMKEEFRKENEEKLKIQKNLKEIDKGSYRSDLTQAFGEPDSKKKSAKKEDWKFNKYGVTYSIEGDRVVGKKIDKKYDAKIDSSKFHEANSSCNKVVDIFETIKTAYPRDNENLNLLLQAYYEAGKTKEATKTFKLAVENEPGNKMNHYILGLLYRTTEDYEGAIAEFNEALKIDPGFTDAIYDVGATYYNWGVRIKKTAQEKNDESTAYKSKFQDALPWMEKVSQIKKDDVKVWESLGTIYALLGQTKKAEKALDEADRIRKGGK